MIRFDSWDLAWPSLKIISVASFTGLHFSHVSLSHHQRQVKRGQTTLHPFWLPPLLGFFMDFSLQLLFLFIQEVPKTC